MRISDWSSDVCSSDLLNDMRGTFGTRPWRAPSDPVSVLAVQNFKGGVGKSTTAVHLAQNLAIRGYRVLLIDCDSQASATTRSEEHTSELQSLMRTSYAAVCLKTKQTHITTNPPS